MTSLVVIGGASLAAIAIGVVLAGGLEHLAWWVAERDRSRHARRRCGAINLRRPA